MGLRNSDDDDESRSVFWCVRRHRSSERCVDESQGKARWGDTLTNSHSPSHPTAQSHSHSSVHSPLSDALSEILRCVKRPPERVAEAPSPGALSGHICVRITVTVGARREVTGQCKDQESGQGFGVRARVRALCGSTPAAQSAGVVNPDGHGAGSAGRGRELPVPRHPHQGQEGEGHGVRPRARRGYKGRYLTLGGGAGILHFF